MDQQFIARPRVLLLDDDQTIRQVLTKLFERRGYEVFSFSSPDICPLKAKPACRCHSQETCTDVIVSDLDMPGMSGLEFIETQRQKDCKCRHVALMSGDWSDEERHRAHELGCETFDKPFRLVDLERWLQSVETRLDLSRTLKDFGLNSTEK